MGEAGTKFKMFTNTGSKIRDGRRYSIGHKHIDFGNVHLSLCTSQRIIISVLMCLTHYERLLSSWGYLYFPGKKLGWGFYSLMLTNVRLAEKKAPPPGALYEKPL